MAESVDDGTNDDGTNEWTVHPVGRVRSTVTDPADAARQPDEGAPPAMLDIHPRYRAALEGLHAGDEVLVMTWLHLAERDSLVAHPRGDRARPQVGVFATRSPSRPNPIGVHRVRISSVGPDGQVGITALEAVDGTPVLDIRPVLRRP
ncbi:MAG TPA: tRNA (N6-threonylcarbamoyladenosine(37)-N6)-methyltransferase TrmO [Kineosporiaceae bacterium]